MMGPMLKKEVLPPCPPRRGLVRASPYLIALFVALNFLGGVLHYLMGSL
jgi:hypothetical protein